jgi:hypothetical protein
MGIKRMSVSVAKGNEIKPTLRISDTGLGAGEKLGQVNNKTFNPVIKPVTRSDIDVT